MLYSNDIADIFASPELFKKSLENYLQAMVNSFVLNNSCTMFLACNCINCRSEYTLIIYSILAKYVPSNLLLAVSLF